MQLQVKADTTEPETPKASSVAWSGCTRIFIGMRAAGLRPEVRVTTV